MACYNEYMFNRAPSLESKSNTHWQIQNLDFKNLTPDDEKLACETISEYFKENFAQYKGISENAEKLNSSIHFLKGDDYHHILEEQEDNLLTMDYTPAFYDATTHAIYFNLESKGDYTNSEIFTFLIHEAFHFCAIENGAGFNVTTSSFSIPDEILDHPELAEKLRIGVLALCEGTTDLFAVEAAENVGFEEYDAGYPLERNLIRGVRSILGQEGFERAFFEMPLEEFRLQFEVAGLPQEEIERSDEVFTGAFSAFLVEFGECVTYCKKTLDTAEGCPSNKEVQEVRNAMNTFLGNLAAYIENDE